MHPARAWWLVAGLAVVSPSAGVAQGPGALELGLDSGVAVGFPDKTRRYTTDSAVVLAVPDANLRLGFFVGESAEIEPSVSLVYASQGSFNAGQLGLGFHYLHNMGNGTSRGFVRTGGLCRVYAGNNSDLQLGLSGGVGLKTRSDPRLGARLELEVARLFGGDFARGLWQVAFKVGFSAYARPRN